MLLGKLGSSAFSCVSSQERANKKQKKAAPAEEEDSGVEVYYREGEEEMEEISVLPKVRGAALGKGGLDSRRRAGLFLASSSFLFPVRYEEMRLLVSLVGHQLPGERDLPYSECVA